jgi:hypothetical protein
LSKRIPVNREVSSAEPATAFSDNSYSLFQPIGRPCSTSGHRIAQLPNQPIRLDRLSIFAKSASLPKIDPIRTNPSGETQGAAIATTASDQACHLSID